jgi:4-deoxy-L-threo-5-hexosulose-uronate ketol-isomerase
MAPLRPLLHVALVVASIALVACAPLLAAASVAATPAAAPPTVGLTTQKVAASIATRETPSIDSYSKLSTRELRDSFLIEKVFSPGEILLTYTTSALDRMIIGGAMPTPGAAKPLALNAASSGSEGAAVLDRRELAVFNIGPGNASISLGDGFQKREFSLAPEEVLYAPLGTQSVEMSAAAGSAAAPKLFLASAPCGVEYPAAVATPETANTLRLGAPETANVRALRQMIAPGVGPASCSLMVGATKMSPGSNMNTMPPHRHLRRSEVYLYFDLPEDQRVFHLMGKPEETRHLVVANEQAVLSPPWSLHAGAGTSSYSFVWVMAGENQDFKDQEACPTPMLM